jgi:hypothetical protein
MWIMFLIIGLIIGLALGFTVALFRVGGDE